MPSVKKGPLSPLSPVLLKTGLMLLILVVHALFFLKAFDLVDHTTLLFKLPDMGVGRSLWVWTKSFLSDRKLPVKLPGAISKPAQVVAGVPQDGVISLTLFNIFINDTEETLPSNAVTRCKYADDCTLYQVVPSDSASCLQDVVYLLESWALRNKMELNAKKTKET